MSFFHLAIPVTDLVTTQQFYEDVLGCGVGRSDTHWVDLNLYGHQLVLHEVAADQAAHQGAPRHNPVDGHDVPVPHFGVILEWSEWESLAARLQAAAVQFVIEPYVRFEGEVGEQATLFFLDPAGNALEFKSFRDMGQIFAR